MACSACECENIKYSCSSNGVPTFNIGKCQFPEAMSMELNVTSRNDCLFYSTWCQAYNDTITRNGIIDCYDRQSVLNDLVNGTYILQRGEDEEVFSYGFHKPNDQGNTGQFTCGYGTSFAPSEIKISAVAARCYSKLPFQEEATQYDPWGNTGYLSLQFPGIHLCPSIIPDKYGSPQSENPGCNDMCVTYITNQPISCKGSVTFILSSLQGCVFRSFQIAQDHIGYNNQYTMYQTSITLTPLS